MKRLILILLLSAFSAGFLLNSCNTLEELECGGVKEHQLSASANSEFIESGVVEQGQLLTYVENGQRFYKYTLYVDDLCTKVHTEVRYNVNLIGVHTLPLDIVGNTSWNFLYEEEAILSDNAIPPHTPVSAEQDIGLFQAFGDDPGWIFINLSLSFPTTGSDNQDSIYFAEHVDFMTIFVNGYYPKDD